MDFRKKTFIGIGISVGLILAGLLYYLVMAPGKKENTENKMANETENIVNNNAKNTTITNSVLVNQSDAVKVNEPDDLYIKQLAVMFVERTGSYSNENDLEHIKEAEKLATTKVVDWLKSRISKSVVFESVTTRVVVSKLLEKKNDKAVVEIGVQQSINKNGLQETKYLTGRVEVVKVAGDWKVDGLYWDK